MKTVAVFLVCVVALIQANILSITVDDQLAELYIHGVAVPATSLPNANKYNTLDTVTLADGAQLVAVKGINIAGATGIIASLSGSDFVSNTTWKCTGVLSNNWYGVSFDDSAWPAAAVSKPVDPSLTGINKAASFIWTTKPDFTTGDKTAYCRGYINNFNGGVGGSTYVRWGRTTCPTGVETVYTGSMLGTHYDTTYNTGAINHLCLTADTVYGTHASSQTEGQARLFGAAYQFNGSPNFDPFLHTNNGGGSLLDQYAPCVVCNVPRSSQVQITGTNVCPTGWTKEYNGYLVSNAIKQVNTDSVCLDEAPESLGKRTTPNGWGVNGLFSVIAGCAAGNLPCGKLQNGWELTCVICTK